MSFLFENTLLDNLKLIDKKYSKDDYTLLYDEIKSDTKDKLEKLNKLNEFQTRIRKYEKN